MAVLLPLAAALTYGLSDFIAGIGAVVAGVGNGVGTAFLYRGLSSG